MPFGGVIAIPVPIVTRPPGGISLSSLAYRSCPAALVDPFVGILASWSSFLTRIFWLFLTLIVEYLASKFSCQASSYGLAYTVGELFKHHVVHRSLSKVIFPSAQSILGLWFLSHSIPSIVSWLCRLAI